MNEEIETVTKRVLKALEEFEEIETATKRVLKALEEFEESKTAENARELERKLTMMKLLVGLDNFERLPAFSRALREASAFVDKCNNDKEEK